MIIINVSNWQDLQVSKQSCSGYNCANNTLTVPGIGDIPTFCRGAGFQLVCIFQVPIRKPKRGLNFCNSALGFCILYTIRGITGDAHRVEDSQCEEIIADKIVPHWATVSSCRRFNSPWNTGIFLLVTRARDKIKAENGYLQSLRNGKQA